jgi:amino acid adenylation domain-containing protein
MMNPTHLFLYRHLAQSAADCPKRAALRDTDGSVTYAGLHAFARAGAHGLQAAGVRRGDRVVLYMENSLDFARAFWAVVYAGAVVTPVSRETRADKLAYILGDCDPAAIITDPGAADEARAAVGPLRARVLLPDGDWARGDTSAAPLEGCGSAGLIDQDLGCIIYTSGSTGRPKGVMLSQQNLVSASRSVAEYLGYRGSDRIFVAIPLTFDYGMHQLTMAALVGATVVIERNFAKPLFSLDRAARSRATVLPVVPTMVPMIDALAARFDLSSVRLISSTAAALDPRNIDRLAARFPQAAIFSMYGLTECHRCTYVPPDRLEEKKQSVGIAIPNTELWVVDAAGRRQRRDAEGELVIRGATVMKGYWNSPERTAERLKPGPFPGEYVFHTGDICRLDAEGFVHFLSRMDDVIKVRGEKVAPKEVEDALRRHPSVTEAIVWGRAATGSEAEVRAAVTLRAGSNATPEALRAWCAERLEPVAVPKRIEVLAAFLLTPNGKIDRGQFADGAQPADAVALQPSMT